MDAGELLLDELIINSSANDCASRTAQVAICSTVPRTLPQTEAMKQAGVAIDYVLEVDLPFDEIIVRMNGRRVDAASGRTYHVNFNRGFL